MIETQVGLGPEGRVLLIINDNVIIGTTRIQKYGFLLYQQHKKELTKIKKGRFLNLDFYNDWEPYYYGPFSRKLKEDLATCIQKQLVSVKDANTENTKRYMLTIKGRSKWRDILFDSTPAVVKINEKIRSMQTIRLFELLRHVYVEYPKYTKNSVIKDKMELGA